MDSLPDDVVVIVLKWVINWNDLSDCRLVCRLWKRLVDANKLFKYVCPHFAPTSIHVTPLHWGRLGYVHGRGNIICDSMSGPLRCGMQFSGRVYVDNVGREFQLLFEGVFASRSTEHDSAWARVRHHSQVMHHSSALYLVPNSAWVKSLGGKASQDTQHYVFVDYDWVFEVAASQLKIVIGE